MTQVVFDSSPLWNPDLPVPRSEIQLSKHCCLAKLIKTVGDKRNGIVVPNGHLIECSVVYAHSKRAFLLLLKKKRCAIHLAGWSRIQQLFQLFPEFFQLRLVVTCDRVRGLVALWPAQGQSDDQLPFEAVTYYGAHQAWHPPNLPRPASRASVRSLMTLQSPVLPVQLGTFPTFQPFLRL